MGSMGNSRQPKAAKKPPVPSDSHGEIDAWIEKQMPGLQPIVRALDGSIRGLIPDLRYSIKWKKAYYGSQELGWVIELVAYDVSVNVVFLAGEGFESPPPLGTGRERYVKVQRLEEAQDPSMGEWIEQAGRLPGWK